MTLKHKTLAILAVLWLLSFLAKPGTLSVFLPPLLLLLAWAAVVGPTFKTSPRHPDIKRVLHSKAMQRLLLRQAWVPSTLDGAWFVALAIALLLPGVLVTLWLHLSAEHGPLTLGDALWWLIMVPLILVAATHLLEALLMQMVALPFVGAFIILLLLLAPSAGKLSGDDPATLAYWLPSIILLLGAVWSLWLLDLLRALYPASERRRRLAHSA